MVRLGQRDTVGAFSLPVQGDRGRGRRPRVRPSGGHGHGRNRASRVSLDQQLRTARSESITRPPSRTASVGRSQRCRCATRTSCSWTSARGRGAALLLASEFPFKRIMGVEFSDELSAIARENVASFPTEAQRCGDIEIVCEDAAEFELPVDPLVLYFYNPFHEPIMREVMRRVVESLDDDPRPAFVILTRTTPSARSWRTPASPASPTCPTTWQTSSTPRPSRCSPADGVRPAAGRARSRSTSQMNCAFPTT